MKKLITIMAAAASALFAFGESGTSLEAYAMGEKTVEALTDYEDDGVGTSSSRYWYYEGADKTVVLGTITNGAPNATADVPSRPAQFADNTNVKYLDLTNSDIGTNVFYRAINSVNGKSSVADLDGSAIGDGFYLDTLVKFTAADSTNNFELASGDKLAITYVEESEDDDEDGGCLSNIVVRAGYVENGTATEKTYIMELPDELKASFVVTNWHRLTVRAIEVGYAAAPVGFVIYLDGCPAPLTYAVGEAAGDSTYTDALAGNAIVNQFLYNSTTHALLPSAVSSGTAKTTLAAVGFMGSGCVDDISFVSGTPGFVEEGKGVAIEWDSGVATVTVRDGDTYYVGSALGGEDVTALAYSATNFTVESSVLSLTVTATYKQGVDGQYEAGTWVTDPVGKYSAATDTLVLDGDNTTLTINSMLPLFQVGETHYGTFAEALTAAVAAGTELSPATIKLLANYNNSISFSTGYIVLDLNGKTLQGGDSSYYTINNSGAELTIIDSASGGTVLAPTKVGAEGAFYTDAGLTTINAGTFESTVYTEKFQDPEATGDIVVNGGVFYDPDYDPDDEAAKFYLYDYLADGVKATYDAGYFTVGEPIIGTYTVTVTPNANATYSAAYNDGGAAVEFVNDVAAVTVGKTITITATPKSGYEYAEQPTGWTLSEGVITKEISAAAEVEIPAPTAESSYPSYIPEDAAVKAKYDTWATTYGADTGSVYEDAFLLNIAPDAVDQTLEPASITMEGGKVVISANQTLTAVNGKVYVKVATTLAGLATAEWTEATLDEGKVQVTPGSSDTAGFYKIKVDF